MKTILKDGTIINSHELPDFISTEIMKNKNFFEHKLLNKLKKLNAFGSGDIIEIGANIGNHVIYYKTQLKGSRKIFAFEPLADNYEILEKNVVENKMTGVEIKKYGLGKKDEIKEFFVNENNFGNSSLILQSGSTRKVSVGIKDVSRELKPLMNSSSFAKIDIEGAEKFMFDELIASLKKKDFCFLIELNVSEYSTLDEYIGLFKKIKAEGFKLMHMPDAQNFLWSSRSKDKDIFSVKKITWNYFSPKVKKLRDEYDASSNKFERKLILAQYSKICNQVSVPLLSKIIWSKFYIFFSFLHFKRKSKY